jgi:predicted glycogen debranching enzyme
MTLPLDSLAIRGTPERPREFLYTDKGGAHFFGEAASPWSRSYHGLYSHMHELLDGWDIELDGKPLERIAVADVFPDRIVRRYDGLTETIVLLDREKGLGEEDVPPGAGLLVELTPDRSGTLRFSPRIDIRFVWEEVRPEYDVRWDPGRQVLLAASRRHLQRTTSEDWPVWLGLACSTEWDFHAETTYLPATYAKDAARRAMARATPYRPGWFELECRRGEPVVVVAVVADDAHVADRLIAHVKQYRTELRAERRSRLQALVGRPGLESSDERLTRAAAWCRLSMDQLVMQQRGLGIYAGYPWFTTYWGRDSFISLAGACLVTGDFATARTILATFAAHQDTDPRSLREGRLPNFVTVNQIQYATADGTWWWVRALRQYEAASGDASFADSLYPVVKRALDGALRHRVDELGFVTHGDGETWMDAGGEAHPYSPRGDRAVEVQALFASALRYGVDLARRAREREDALRWQDALERLAASFASQFFDAATRVAYDHLNAGGTPDLQVRPNGLLAWFAAPDLFAPDQARATIEQVRDRLAYPWSVGSLAASDPQFRPVHLALDRYYFDEAYHNGDVWLWLSGPLVSGLVSLHQPDAAWQQTSFLMDEILERGVAGSLREIRDAVETPGKDEFGGAVAQAWSLAELQRNLYEDYLGVRADIPTGRITIAPMLPEAITRLAARVPAGSGGWLRVEHERRGSAWWTCLTVESGCEGLEVWLVLTRDDGRRARLSIPLHPGLRQELAFDRTTGRVTGDPITTIIPPALVPEPPALPPRGRADFRFHPPALLPER